MKKFFTLLIFIYLSTGLIFSQPWCHLLSTGQPYASYFLGDKLPSNTWLNFETGVDTWISTDMGIGSSQTVGANWISATWYADGTWPNKQVHSDFSNFQFTSVGNWYFYGRLVTGSGTSYANNATWSNSTSLNASEYFSVSALGDPTIGTCAIDGTLSSSKINLAWTRWSGNAVERDVLIVRSTDATFTAPTNGTAYNAGDLISGDEVVYRGSATTFADSDADLQPGQTYYYKFYSENWSYYSAGVATSDITLDATPAPTACSATAFSYSQIDLSWTPNVNYTTVIIVARQDVAPDDLTNGSSYTQGTGNLTDGLILYKGTSTSVNHTSLTESTTYHYKYFTVINDKYYSANDVNTTKSATTPANPNPTITSFTPATGYVGSTITITGTNFTGVTSVSFGGTVATSFTVNSSTEISAVVALGTSGDVTVVTGSGTANKSGFTFGGYISTIDGDWNTGTTWLGGNVPPAASTVTVDDAVTVNAVVANNPSTLTINSGSSLTFGASGDITINTTLTNNGTIDMTSGGILRIASGATLTNNSTFTGGTGEVFFAGVGTVSGTITFANVSIAGGVNFGANSSVNNILQIYGGGWLNTNSITYNSGSTLKYAGNYTINSGDKSWYSNVVSTGSAQLGIPWNVTIPSGVTVTLNDSYQFDMNGNLNIGGTFILGTDGTTHWGDLALRGDFIFNNLATFTHNDRSVKFIGTALQNISGTNAPVFKYLEVNNSSNLNLQIGVNVATQITFTNGKIILNNYNIHSGSSTISNYDNSKYFVTNGTGYLLRVVGATETVFPVGTSTVYAPAYLTQAGTQENLYVRVKQGIDNATTDNTFTVNLQWTIDEQTAGSNNITTKFQWVSSLEGTSFNRVLPVQIGRYIGSYATSDATVAGTNPYTASAAGMNVDISAEIPFIVANTSAFISNGYRTAQNGDWATGSTWVGGIVPPVNSVCTILHHVTVSSTLVDATDVSIYEGKSVTFNTNGVLTVTGNFNNQGMLKTNATNASLTVNTKLQNFSTGSVNMVGGGTLTFGNASTFTNSGSFTSGTGTVVFSGTGTCSGTLVFNNLNITGGNVDLGNTASLNGVLTLSGTGDLITNSIIYTEGSLLKFDRNYSLADNKVWLRNNDATGAVESGIPWDVEIASSRTVQYTATNDFREINGKITINGTFELGDGTNSGELRIRSHFINNGTFTHRNQTVEFKGSVLQEIGGTATTNFYNLKINTAANVALKHLTTVANNLDLTTGKILLGNYNLTAGNVINSTSSKYVVTNGTGYLIQNVGTTEKTFPIGTNNTYNPAFLTNGTVAEDIKIRVQNSIDNAVNDPTRIVNTQWTISEATAGNNNLQARFNWNSTDQASGFSCGAGTVQIAYYNGTYNNAVATENCGTPSAQFTFAPAIDFTSGLPVIVANSLAFVDGIYTIADGDWNNIATWNLGNIPETGEACNIYHDVTLSANVAAKSISISTGTLDCNNFTITLDNGGAIANTSNPNFIADLGTVIFNGTGTISTGAITFNNVTLNGAVSFGANTTIGGTLQLNSGGTINTNPPIYAVGSTLKYNQNVSVIRGSEWLYNIASDQPGYPHHVLVTNNTTLNIDGDNNDVNYYQTRFIKGNLTVDNGSTLTLDNMGGGTSENQICGLYVIGNIVNSGTLTLSSAYGGDMMLEGNLTNNGTINWNSRAVFFTGDEANQNIYNVTQIPFILMTRGANVILNNNLLVNGSGTEFITFARPSSTKTGSIDLGSYTLTCSGAGNIELNNITGAEVTGTGRVEVSGGNCLYNGTSSGSLSFGPNVTLAINGGTMTFPSTLGIITVYGTLEVGDGATISNIPTYGDNSTLHYKKSGNFNVGVEWPAGSNVADNIPFDVTVGMGATAGNLTLATERFAIGELTIESGGTLNLAPGTGWLTVNNLDVQSNGTLIVKSPDDMGPTGSFITTGTTIVNNGTTIAERFLSTGQWSYLTPSNTITSSTLFTNVPSGYFNGNLYIYNESYAAPDGDPDAGTYSEWRDTDNKFDFAWTIAHNSSSVTGSTLSTPGKGYAYRNYEDHKFSFSGAFLTGDVNVTLTYNDNDGNTGYFDGWNLIANPYPSYLDWNSTAWDKTNVGAAVYYWDGAAANYKYYVSSGNYSDGSDVVNGGTQKIPPMQGFFVKAINNVSGDPDSYNFTIPNAARVHGNDNFWKGEQAKDVQQIQNIRLQVSGDGFVDETVIRFIENATNGVDDNFDAYKMYSTANNVPQIYSVEEINNFGLAINSLPQISNNIPLGFAITKTEGTTEFTIEATNILVENKWVFLNDIVENKSVNLINNPIYYFSLTTSETMLIDIRDRFYLNFTDNNSPEVVENLTNQDVVYGNSLDYTFENIFNDEDIEIGDQLILSAKLSDENSLPEWLIFDNQNNKFSGTPDNSGVYDITVTATDKLGAMVETSFTINVLKANLNITADNKSRDYAEQNPDFTLTYNSFVLTDDLNVLDGVLPFATCTADLNSLAGQYDINVSADEDNNYNITVINGILTVNAVSPSVSDVQIADITVNSANISATLLSHGGDINTEKGICWSTNQFPTTDDNALSSGTGTGLFTQLIDNLLENTDYFVRAYAINSTGTVYSEQSSFKTLDATNIDFNSSDIQIYPNPTSGILFIENVDISNVEIYSVDGKLVNFKTNGNQIDLSGLTKGVYILKIINADEVLNYSIELK